jgi:hypothetical protein
VQLQCSHVVPFPFLFFFSQIRPPRFKPKTKSKKTSFLLFDNITGYKLPSHGIQNELNLFIKQIESNLNLNLNLNQEEEEEAISISRIAGCIALHQDKLNQIKSNQIKSNQTGG